MGRRETAKHEHTSLDSESGEAIVLLHGLGMNADVWDTLVSCLPKEYTVVRYVLPGHGQKKLYSARDVSWDTLLRDFHQFVSEIHSSKIHLVAHGFSAALAIEFAKLFPHSVTTLTLISIHAGFYARPTDVTESMFDEIRAQGNASPIGKHLAKLLCYSCDPGRVSKIEQMYEQLSADWYLRLIKLVADTASIEDINEVRIPAFLMFGDVDPLTPAEVIGRIKAEVKAARMLIMPNASNCVHMDRPNVAAKWIVNFIREATHDLDTSYARLSDARCVISSLMDTSASHVWDIEIKCLGGFQASVRGQIVQSGWNQRYAKEILVYLALRGGNATRDELCDVFWPDADVMHARSYLRVCINHLRHQLNTGNKGDLLFTDRSHVFIKGKIHCDMQELELRIERAALLPEKEKAEYVERLMQELPVPLFSGLYHEHLSLVLWNLEVRLTQLIDSSVEYYRSHSLSGKSQWLETAAAKLFPAPESAR